MSFFSANDIIMSNLLHESSDKSDVENSNDEKEDIEDDVIEFDFDENVNDFIAPHLTLSSLVPSLDTHIENYSNFSFTQAFLNVSSLPFESPFIEGPQDFEVYTQNIMNSAISNRVNFIANNWTRSETFELLNVTQNDAFKN